MHPTSTPLCVHIGLSKTATTTLQRSLFRKHQQIHYLGQYVPSSVPMLCESKDVYQILRPLLWDTDKPLNAPKLRQDILRTLLRIGDPTKRLVASWEGLASRRLETNVAMMQRVTSSFGGCKLLLTLRNPLTRLPSEYIENLKGHFIKGNYRWMGRHPYISIDQWLERAESHGHFQNMISYGHTLEAAVSLLGRDNVGVFLFEELNESPNHFFTKVCEFLDIDTAEGLALTHNQHLHLRRTEGEVSFLRRLNNSPLRKLLLSFASRRIRRAVLEEHADGQPAASPALPNDWTMRIISETAPSHRWIAQTFNLPLAKYGYPLDGKLSPSHASTETKAPR